MREAATGSMLPWKLAMWGSHRDARLLKKASIQFPPLRDYAVEEGLTQPYQGFPLRERRARRREKIEFVEGLVGKLRIDFQKLRNCGRIFAFPASALWKIPRSRAYMRLRSGTMGLEVSRPPHVVIDAARKFAIYSDDFIAIQQPHVGIAGGLEHASVLKALSLYLNSDFAIYHQFLLSSQWGIDTTIATLDALRELPVPLGKLSSRELEEWSDLQSALATASAEVGPGLTAGKADVGHRLAGMISELNERVFDLLGLRKKGDRALVEDLVNTRMGLIKGKVTSKAMGTPSTAEVQAYLTVLARELDAFVGAQAMLRHDVIAVLGKGSSMVCIETRRSRAMRRQPVILDADSSEAEEFRRARENLRRRHSQWVYFDRSLRVYDGHRTYLLKPTERLHWTRTQALLDAGEVIAETLALGEN
jgi:hypothetical protein